MDIASRQLLGERWWPRVAPDVMIDPIMNVWDCAALQPVLEEAGGAFTDWRGEPTIYSGQSVATNGLILRDVLAITRQTP